MSDDMEHRDSVNSWAVAVGWTHDRDGWVDMHADYLSGQGALGLAGKGEGIPVFGIRATMCVTPNGPELVCTIDGEHIDPFQVAGALHTLRDQMMADHKRPTISTYEG